MNMEGIDIALVSNTEPLYKETTTASASKEKSFKEKAAERKYFYERDNYLMYCHDVKHTERTECMKQFVKKQVSTDDLRRCFRETIEAAYEELTKSCYFKEGDEISFLNVQFFNMKVEINQIAEGANLMEGWRVARSYGISERRCVYYNAEYYYLHEEMGEILRDCFNEFAEEKNLGDLKNEEYFAKKAHPEFGFNSSWSSRYKNIKMINIEADPPRNFVFFYGENWETSKEVLYVNGEGISSGSGETLELSGSQEEKGKHFNFLDFIKSKYEGQEELLERLHYLKNFRIYSLKRMLLNY